MTPTNTDLAAALREIADTLPFGSQLIVRLAADRLTTEEHREPCGDPDREPWDGWIEWDAKAPDSEYGPDTGDQPIDVRLLDGREWVDDGDTKSEYFWDERGSDTISHYRLSRK